MNDLSARAVAAHGGLDRWNKFKKVTATYVGGWGLWPMKGLGVIPNPAEVTVTLHEETWSINPFGLSFTPNRVAIGNVVRERSDARASFAGHVLDTPWDALHRVDVAGGFPTTQYVYDIVEVDGLRFPTKRRVYFRGPHLKPIRDLLMVSITYDGFRLDGSS
jgi:hypothetical protein